MSGSVKPSEESKPAVPGVGKSTAQPSLDMTTVRPCPICLTSPHLTRQGREVPNFAIECFGHASSGDHWLTGPWEETAERAGNGWNLIVRRAKTRR